MQDRTENLNQIRNWIKKNRTEGMEEVSPVRHKVVQSDTKLAPIAITGVSGYFPGCMNVQAFWDNLENNVSMISEIPIDRFDWRKYWDPTGQQINSTCSKWGGFIPDIASFDPELFGISPHEADEMDPRQRLLLMSTWQTLLDASIEISSLKKSNTGVFIACEANEYAQLMQRQAYVPSSGMTQTDSMIANRISYEFDFAGPSEMINATCAGFAVALHRAVVSLRAGLIDRAIVGAANLILLPDAHVLLSESEQLSHEDTVRSFGKDGNGFVRSEGVGTILIERLEDAEQAGRKNYAVIKHTAVNFNGQGGVSMTAPNVEAHSQLVKKCLQEANIDPCRIGYIEAQGMGSPVADIAEWSALNRALTELYDETGKRVTPGACKVSTLKPLLGHMHSASSLGALLKIIRSLQTGLIYKVANFDEPNEYCDMEDSPCRIVKETEVWKSDGQPRLAGFHSYGSGGNNVHVVLEEGQGAERLEYSNNKRFHVDLFNKRHCWFKAEEQAAKRIQPSVDISEVRVKICEWINLEDKEYTHNTPFLELGLDSLAIVGLVSKLKDYYGVSLRKSDAYSYTTPATMASHVSALVKKSERLESSKVPTAEMTNRSKANYEKQAVENDDIAIIGMHLKVAGAENTSEFWQLLKEGKCTIASIPQDRCAGGIEDDTKQGNAKGGFIRDIASFDASLFKLAPKECESIDPRHRLLLESAWSAIEDSGYSPEDWKDAMNGIFIGIEESDYPITKDSAITSVHGGTAPARIGYFLDSKGPLLALSTACSSSLVAVHSACQSIINGESEVAIAGGCNLVCQPERTFFALSQMGNMLSPDGKCYAFDSRANGMVIGEGVGLVVLKSLSAARRDGDSVYAVIKGSGINYDGRTNGLTAPSGERQRELYEQVYEKSGVNPEQISYVVSHGTGTALGDPVEANALIDAFTASTDKKQFCALTSPKSNVGHAQAAAGVVNLITAALALHNEKIPPSLNYKEENDDIAFKQSPFYVNSKLKDWQETERYAAVSAFGHTGTNAHMVLGQADVSTRKNAEEAEREKMPEPVAMILSAASEAQLKAMAGFMLALPEQNLRDLAYTLQVGRVEMDYRIAFVIDSWNSFQSKLNSFLTGVLIDDSFFQGEVEELDHSLDTYEALQKRDLITLTDLWVQGALVPWAKLYLSETPRRLHLPTYAFERERYWLEPEKPVDEKVVHSDHELLTFKETWEPEGLESLKDTVSNVFVTLSHSHGQRELLNELKKVAAGAQVLAIHEETSAGVAETLIQHGRRESSESAVLFMHRVEDKHDLMIPEELLVMVKALPQLEKAPARFIIAVSFSNDLERSFADAWVGFAMSVQHLLPRTQVRVVGIDASSEAKKIQIIWDEFNSAIFENVFYLEQRRHVRKVEESRLDYQKSEIILKTRGTYLISGGLGGVGYLFAQYLVKNYQANLALLGRSSLSSASQSELESLRKLGSRVEYFKTDVSKRKALHESLTLIKQEFGNIDGVIHSAGIEGRVSVLEKESSDYAEVLDSKVRGTVLLDELLEDEPLDFMALFSSTASILGDVGVADYAMASRFQTAYTFFRNNLLQQGQRFGKTIVFNWPMWEEGKMVDAKSERSQFFLATSGQRALMTEEGFQVFEQALSQTNGGQCAVVCGKREKVLKMLVERDAKASMESLPVRLKRKEAAPRKFVGDSIQERIEEDLKEGISGQLNIATKKLKLKTNFQDFGFDSMSLAEFAEWLSEHYGAEITPAVFFGYSTIAQLTQYFMENHGALMEDFYVIPEQTEIDKLDGERFISNASTISEVEFVEKATKKTVEQASVLDEPIAIIGMSGRFPQARNVESMWSILAEGECAVEEIPLERYDWRSHYGDRSKDRSKTNGKWCGLLPGVDEFDPLFFEISPREAAGMDPRQRHLLQESWNALEDAGYGPQQLAEQQIGMFVGVEEGDYVFLADGGEITSNHSGVLASRLAYFLDLQGPILALNTACSSGLVAAHQACLSLRNGECDAALAAGVNIHATPAGLVAMGQSEMLSSDGKCHTFDNKANGMVPGEAVVTLVLKPLSKAEADGDPIHAVIRGSGVNYDGKTNGITAPSMKAQANLLKSVYSRYDVAPASIDYIVAHGTGTKLGDPVEINALAEVFKGSGVETESCALTSTKTNFGHCFAASGLLSVVSLVESIKHETIPASLHCDEESSYYNWSNSPFYVNKKASPWVRSPGQLRRGGVSAFGMSGTNAHMVVEEYVRGSQSGSELESIDNNFLLVLSAKTEESLRQRVAAMIELVDNGGIVRENIANVSLTLLKGRHHFQYRMAIVVGDAFEAKELWLKALDGEQNGNLISNRVVEEFRGQKVIQRQAENLVNETKLLLSKSGQSLEHREILAALAAYYCQGYELPWEEMFAEGCKRVHLPSYPFARERYWLKAVSKAADSIGIQEKRMHPLLHSNISDFGEQRFSSRFTGAEFFLKDHKIQGQRVLPGVAHIEMALAGMIASTPREEQLSKMLISRLVWLSPVVLGDKPYEVSLGLMEAKRGAEFELYSLTDNGEELIHSEGRLHFEEQGEIKQVDVDQVKESMKRGHLVSGDCYAAFDAVGMEYGDSFQVLSEMFVGDDEVLASLSLPEVLRDGMDRFDLHPSMMDGAFQATLGLSLFKEEKSSAMVPFSIESLEIFASCPTEAWVWVRQTKKAKDEAGMAVIDIDVCDREGNICVKVNGFTTRTYLGNENSTKGSRVRSFSLTGKEFYLQDHGGLLPGVVSLDWALRAAGQKNSLSGVGLKNVIWSKAVIVDTEAVQIEVLLNDLDDEVTESNDRFYQILAGGELHAQGKLTTDLEMNALSHDLEDYGASCQRSVSYEKICSLLETKVGPSFSALRDFRYTEGCALANLVMPETLKGTKGEFILHPSILNGAVQAANVLLKLTHPEIGVPLPFGLERVQVFNEIPEQTSVVVREVRGASASSPTNKYDIDIVDRGGTAVVSLHGYTAMAAKKDSRDVLFAKPLWIESDLDTDLRELPFLQVPPLFILKEEDSNLSGQLRSQWKGARIEYLDSIKQSFDGQFTQVFAWIKEVIAPEGSMVPPVCMIMNGQENLAEAVAFGGLLKTAKMEKASFVGKVISFEDWGKVSIHELLKWVRDELVNAPTDLEIRYDIGGERSIRSLREVEIESVDDSCFVKKGSVIWITGGLGGLGKIFAEHFALIHRARLVLSGRSNLNKAGEAWLENLSSQGCQVRYVQGDVTKLEEVEAMFSSILGEEGELNGVIHSAGVIDDAYIVKKSQEAVACVMRPKVLGALALDEVTKEIDLDFFVLCSSLTGVFGNVGQADYAGANGFLDGFAHDRSKLRSGKSLSINWPLWRDGGMGMDAESERLLKHQSGMVVMDSSAGIKALEMALMSDLSQVLVAQGESNVIRQKLLSASQERDQKIENDSSETTAGRDSVVTLEFQQKLVELVSELQKIPVEKIELGVELSKYGFDSLGMTALANSLNETYDLDLMPTVFFEFSTLKSLSKYLLNSFSKNLNDSKSEKLVLPLSEVERGKKIQNDRRKRSRVRREERFELVQEKTNEVQPIAIVGVSGRFPGAADLDTFWEHLEANSDLLSEVPDDRWSWREHYGDPAEELGKTKVKVAGFIDGVDLFDAAFFGVSPREAIAMDPQFRLLMETTWEAIEDAGYSAAELAGSKTGVFMGASTSDYKDAWLQEVGNDLTKERPPFVSHFVLANRISYTLDLHGPSEPIDTACSSSLVAIHRAIESIRQGNCTQALVGGVNVISSPNITLGASRAGMLSEDGKCKTFDKSADGYGRGEGLGVIFLKPLDKAVEAGDPIYGLVRGSAENHGGKANSPTSPNPAAQKDLLVTAYEKAGIDPRSVGYIEAHGTGTELGDPIEINGLRSAFKTLYEKADATVQDQHCGLGSVKANIGHLEAAAGIAGVVKVLLMFRHQKLPGNPNLNEPNPYLELEGSPFYLLQETLPWSTNGSPRRAGVSSFGIGGSNAHVILEEYRQSLSPLFDESIGNQVIVLSAKNEGPLKVMAQNLLTALERPEALGNPSLEEIAYTLQNGREAFGERLGFVVESLDEMKSKLSNFITDQQADGFYRKSLKAKSNRRFDDNTELEKSVLGWIKEGKLERVVELWGRGVEIDWSALHPKRKLRRISLPTYPFERKSFWFRRENKKTTKGPRTEPSVESKVSQIGKIGKVEDSKLQVVVGREKMALPELKATVVQVVKKEGSGITKPIVSLISLEEPKFKESEFDSTQGEVNEKLKYSSLADVSLEEPGLLKSIVDLPEEEGGDLEMTKDATLESDALDFSRESIVENLRSWLATILFMSEEEIESDRPFVDLGLDSVIGVEWVQSINKHYGIKIAATKIYDYPTLDEMVDFLANKVKSDPQTLEEILELVQHNKITVMQADRMLNNLKLN